MALGMIAIALVIAQLAVFARRRGPAGPVGPVGPDGEPGVEGT
jgi:hypothetical protein